jgi:hypothetical protein
MAQKEGKDELNVGEKTQETAVAKTFTEEEVKKIKTDIIAEVTKSVDGIKMFTDETKKGLDKMTCDLEAIVKKYEEPVKDDDSTMWEKVKKYATWDRFAIAAVCGVAGYAIGARSCKREMIVLETERSTDSLSSI